MKLRNFITAILLILPSSVLLHAQTLSITSIQPSNGAPGIPITIYGTGFDATAGDNIVTFTPVSGGTGTTAAATSASATKLTVTIPTGMDGGNYTLQTERNSDGSTTSYTGLFGVITGEASYVSENMVSSGGAESVYADDVDGDGDLDLISGPSNSIIAWYENDGTGSFTEHGIRNTGVRVYSVDAGDVDGDGDLDLMSASSGNTLNSGEIAWYENDGDESFTTHVVSTTTDGARSVYASDVDGDGDLDLVSASAFDDKIAWFENDGAAAPSFAGHIVSTSANGAGSVYVGDVDGDGDLDLMSASLSDNKIAWYKNNGAADPSFTEQVVSTNANGAESVYAGDVDGDGDLDLMSASFSSSFTLGKIAWYENDGTADPDFTERAVSTGTEAHGAQSVYAGDVGGDGDLDLMAAFSTTGNNKIVWYENSFFPLPAAPSPAGRSLAFDGTDDYVESPDHASLDITNSFTIEAWVKPDSPGAGVQRIVSKPDAYGFGFNDSQLWFTTYGHLDYKLNFSVPSGEWVHLAVVLDSNNDAIFYANGKSVGTVTGSTSADIAATSITLGQIGSDDQFLSGVLDEVRIWNRQLSEAEIQTNLFQSLNGDEVGLAGYWPLDEGVGSSTADYANGNNGTLTGGPTWSTDAAPYGTFITGTEGWRIMSSPIDGASYGALLDTLWTQGFTGADANAGASNVYFWDEASQQFTSVSNASDVPGAGTGMLVYIYDDQDFDGTPDGFPKMIQVDNAQNDGTVSPTLSYTDNGTPADDGWNLVGNPYGTTIDWDASSGWTTSNLDNVIYVWSDAADGGNGDYLSWNGTSGTLGDGLLAPWQGFWVKANATDPSLSLTDEVRSSGGVFYKESGKDNIPQISFTLQGENSQSQAVMMFSEKAKPGKDPLDAWKLQSLNKQYLSLYTTDTERHALDINALPIKMESPLQLNLDFKDSDLGGKYTLSWNPEVLPAKMGISLKDTYTDRIINLTEAGHYSFKVEDKREKTSGGSEEQPSGTSTGQQTLLSDGSRPQHGPIPTVLKAKAKNPRFVLMVNPNGSGQSLAEIPETAELNQNYPNPFNPETVIHYGVPKQAKVQLNVYDVLGRKVKTLINEQKSPGNYEARFNGRSLSSGLYFYRLKIGAKIITKKMTLIK